MKSKNLECTTDMQWSCKTWRRSGLNVFFLQNQISSRDARKSSNFFVQKTTQDPFTLTIKYLKFIDACGDLNWNRERSTPHTSETDGRAERAAPRVKAGASSVLVQSGLQKGWWAEAMECYCNLRTVQADSQTPYERQFNSPFEGPIIPTGAEVETNPLSPKDGGRVHQFGTKVLPGIFMGYALNVGGSGLVIFWYEIRKILKRCHHLKCTEKKEIQFSRGGHSEEKERICIPM